MSNNSNNTVLSLALPNVGYTAQNIPEPMRRLLLSDIDAARAALGRSGLTLDDADPADVNLLTAYASWLFNKRRTGEAKPPMLTSEIRDRQVAKATGGDG